MSRRRATRAYELEATIGELAPGGDGVALAEVSGERRAIFVRGVAVGDRVRLEVDPSRRPARGIVKQLLTSGADRVEPPCPHASRCGGCDWMHLSLDAQVRTHADQVRHVLPEAWRDVPVVAHAAPEALGYRVRARLHLRSVRSGGGRRFVIGMHEAGTHDPVEVDRCVVLAPALERARTALASLLEGCEGRGEAQVALGTDGAPVLELRWEGSVPGEAFARLERAVAAREWAGARVFLGDVARPAVVGDPTPWMQGADGTPLRLAPGGFGQASEAANTLLARRVAEVVANAAGPEKEAARVVELYAGAGNLSVVLAPHAADLTTVESHREACEAARANLAARGLSARVVEADAAGYAWSPATRVLVLDPPRTGAKEVASRLAVNPRGAPRTVVYVSCDPQTLKRDLSLLTDIYTARSVETFEMFPHTSHVETVVALERVRDLRGRA
jgi:23S rRNA (uracil1939-C5)-methyltransferase